MSKDQTVGPIIGGLAAVGGAITGIFSLVGAFGLIFDHGAMEVGGIYLLAAAVAFGLLAIAASRNDH